MKLRKSDKRRFSSRQRVALFLAARGACALCGGELSPKWHADHVLAFSRDGATDAINGQALCPTCNLRKGASDADNCTGFDLTDSNTSADANGD